MFYANGFIVGNNSTSLIDAESVSNITKRSIPIPMPPVGGIPYSNACTKSSSHHKNEIEKDYIDYV